MVTLVRLFQNCRRIYVQNQSILKKVNVYSIFPGHALPLVRHCATETTRLEKLIEFDIKSNEGAKILERLKNSNVDTILSLPKRLWGSVFYNLSQNKAFGLLDEVRALTKNLDINCGEGALTTLIRSYVARNQPLDAVDVLDEVKKTGLLKHTRTYFPVITNLAKNGFQNRAFELFEEMQHHTFKSNKDVSLSIPSDMVVALIMSCIQSEISEYKKAHNILHWYNYSGKPLTLDIMKAINAWLCNDPVDDWSLKQCQISEEEGRCNNCGKCLNSGQLMSNERNKLKLDILGNIENIFNSEAKVHRKERFRRYVTFLKHCIPCEIIIDGMSIGLSSNVDKRKKRFNYDALSNVSDNFVRQGKNVLVVLNTSIPPSFLSRDVQYFMSDTYDDDLYIMYGCATWNMAPFLVTRDKFREHRFLLAYHNHASYLKWTRAQTIKIGYEGDALVFHRKTYDPVVQKENSTWHFPLVDGSWFCARKI